MGKYKGKAESISSSLLYNIQVSLLTNDQLTRS